MGQLVKLLNPKYTPIAIYRVKEFPDYAVPSSGKGCIVSSMLMPAWENGRTVAATADRIGCIGALNGLGLGGDAHENRLGTAGKYAIGTEEEPGKKYFCSQEVGIRDYIDKVPVYGSSDDIAVVQPIDEAEAMGAPIEVVAFLSDGLEMSALITLAGFSGMDGDTVIRSGFGYSCEQVFAMAKQEGESDHPRMVLGMTEFFPRRFIDSGRMSISMPYSMYRRMDDDAERSFLSDDRWRDAAQPKKNDNCCC